MPSAGLWNESDPMLWARDIYLGSLHPFPDSVRLISLDVFDTLLLRSCAQPGDVFELTAHKALQAGAFARPVTPAGFRAMRHAAEQRARELDRTGAAETPLELIYEQLPSRLGDRQLLLELELEAEREVCWVNPNVLSLIRYCHSRGVRIALLSDMYLSSGQMLSLLAPGGLDGGMLDAVLVSAEQGCGKRSGGLFDVLLRQFPDIRPEHIVHIGDNEAADVLGAASRSIRSIHYAVVPEHIGSPYHWETVRHGYLLPELGSVRKLAGATRFPPTAEEVGASTAEKRDALGTPDAACAGTTKLQDDLAPAADGNEAFFYRFGAGVLGPFVQGLCDWALDVCVAEGRTEVHPLMREAHLLGPALENAARARGLAIAVKPLYVSRQATLLASMTDYTERELERVMSLSPITFREALDMLGGGTTDTALPEELGRYADMPAAELRDLAVSPPDAEQAGPPAAAPYEAVKRYMLSEPVRKRALRTMDRQRKLLLDYIRQTCRFPDKLVTVDLGFNGTIQAALDAAYAGERNDHQALHLLAVGSKQAAQRLLQGIDLRCWIEADGDNNDMARRFSRSPGLIEELSMGRFGSTVRYERADGDEGAEEDSGHHRPVRPVLAKLAIPEEQFRFKEACQRGVFAFQSGYEQWRSWKPELVRSIGAREWAGPLHRTLDMPTPAEAASLGDLVHQDNFGGVQIVRLCEPLPLDWQSRGGDYLIDLAAFGPKTANVFWPQGTVTRHEPYRLYRSFLRLNDSFGSAVIAFNMMEKLTRQGYAAPILYGKGDFARQLAREALLHGVHIAELVEPSANSSPFEADAVEPALRKAILNGGTHPVYVLGTLTDIAEYRQSISEGYKRLRPDVVPIVLEPLAWPE
ncbi:HAD family hydrolase [Paenibacillus hodogayensis]|uniref:HAD family hydrolase n=1 Tax=Paenibacillus hodogayensis TaxID=279208 RepID=A0ABV5W929_9BACL